MIIDQMVLKAEGAATGLTFPLNNTASTSKYICTAAEGLDAEGILRTNYATVGSPAAIYNQFDLPNRTIKLKLALNPNYGSGQSFSGLRDDVYKLISSNRSGMMRLEFSFEGFVVAIANGYISSVETSLFTNSPELIVTLDCDNPVFESPSQVVMSLSGQTSSSMTVTDTASTAPHGMRFELTLTAARVDFTLSAPGQPWSFKIQRSIAFANQDKLVISNERGVLTCQVRLNAFPGLGFFDCASDIVPGSVWPMVFPGSNSFTSVNSFTLTKMSYYRAYWGV